ncbi:hypothetical protein K502DRAFT_323831 [Neoconidiobolus thromboides FSU 785]|nr:hypothetical protein K502DRAFT_323831 [Neoconidiobolus thromboides FSU 785]
MKNSNNKKEDTLPNLCRSADSNGYSVNAITLSSSIEPITPQDADIKRNLFHSNSLPNININSNQEDNNISIETEFSFQNNNNNNFNVTFLNDNTLNFDFSLNETLIRNRNSMNNHMSSETIGPILDGNSSYNMKDKLILDNINYNILTKDDMLINDNILNNDDDRRCRICFDSEENQELGRLISPCHCKGSMKYVHLNCLNLWRLTSSNNNNNQFKKDSSFLRCDNCLYQYSFLHSNLAKLVTYPITRFLLSSLIFILIIIFAGFISKYLLLFINNEDIEELLNELNLDSTTNDLFYFTIDKIHLFLGVLLVGTIGFLTLLIRLIFMGTLPILGLRYTFTSMNQNNGRNPNNASSFPLILFSILLLGSLHSFYSLFKFINHYIKCWQQAIGLKLLDVSTTS